MVPFAKSACVELGEPSPHSNVCSYAPASETVKRKFASPELLHRTKLMPFSSENESKSHPKEINSRVEEGSGAMEKDTSSSAGGNPLLLSTSNATICNPG